MPILHMETDVVRGVGNQLQQTADLMLEHTQQLNTTIQSLNSSWQGPSADIFISDIHPVLQQLNQLFDTSTTLNQRLQREVDEWEQVDRNGFTPVASTILIDNPGILEDIREGFAILFPYTLEEGMDFLQQQPAGQDLIEFSEKNKITFMLEDAKIGYQGDDGEIIEITLGSSVGGGSYDNDSITISDSILERARTQQQLAAILAHEMQHAVDDNMGKTPNLVPNEELVNYFDQSPEIQQDIRQRLADEFEYRLDTEIRAYERQEAILNGVNYHDDGIMTHEERQTILEKQLNLRQDYEKYYEDSLADLAPGAEFDVWLDQQGELHIEIRKPEPRNDDWWPPW